MFQQYAACTDHVSNIIHVIQLGGKTGFLNVERSDTAENEQGRITFTLGQITDVHVGKLQGQQALRHLNTWGPCRFIFTPTATARTIRPLEITRTTHQFQENQPTSYGAAQLSQATGPLSIPTQQTEPLAQLHALQPAVQPPPPQRCWSAGEGFAFLTRSNSSHLHRNLFLLINGRRTALDLARLSGQSLEQVRVLLNELETMGIIQQ